MGIHKTGCQGARYAGHLREDGQQVWRRSPAPPAQPRLSDQDGLGLPRQPQGGSFAQTRWTDLERRVSILDQLFFANSVVDPWPFGTDPDPWALTTDLRVGILLFRLYLQNANKKYFFVFKVFFALYFLKVHLHQSSKIKSHKVP